MLCVEYRVHIKDVVTKVNGSRLVYRKGVDLVVKIIPIICKKKFFIVNVIIEKLE